MAPEGASLCLSEQGVFSGVPIHDPPGVVEPEKKARRQLNSFGRISCGNMTTARYLCGHITTCWHVGDPTLLAPITRKWP